MIACLVVVLGVPALVAGRPRRSFNFTSFQTNGFPPRSHPKVDDHHRSAIDPDRDVGDYKTYRMVPHVVVQGVSALVADRPRRSFNITSFQTNGFPARSHPPADDHHRWAIDPGRDVGDYKTYRMAPHFVVQGVSAQVADRPRRPSQFARSPAY